MSGTRLLEYGGYWIGAAHGTDALYAYRYDAGKRATRRRALGTKILDEAKDKLIGLAGATKSETSRSPDRVMMMAALDHYYENVVGNRKKPGFLRVSAFNPLRTMGERWRNGDGSTCKLRARRNIPRTV